MEPKSKIEIPFTHMTDSDLTEFVVKQKGFLDDTFVDAVIDQMVADGWELGVTREWENEYWCPKQQVI